MVFLPRWLICVLNFENHSPRFSQIWMVQCVLYWTIVFQGMTHIKSLRFLLSLMLTSDLWGEILLEACLSSVIFKPSKSLHLGGTIWPYRPCPHGHTGNSRWEQTAVIWFGVLRGFDSGVRCPLGKRRGSCQLLTAVASEPVRWTSWDLARR